MGCKQRAGSDGLRHLESNDWWDEYKANKYVSEKVNPG